MSTTVSQCRQLITLIVAEGRRTDVNEAGLHQIWHNDAWLRRFHVADESLLNILLLFSIIWMVNKLKSRIDNGALETGCELER